MSSRSRNRRAARRAKQARRWPSPKREKAPERATAPRPLIDTDNATTAKQERRHAKG